jgi:hypothetical protein
VNGESLSTRRISWTSSWSPIGGTGPGRLQDFLATVLNAAAERLARRIHF